MASVLLSLLAVSGMAEDVPGGWLDGPVVIAHRSAELGGFPENSLAAVDWAVSRGVDVLHVNPQMTRDGQYVLMHDPTLNRTTDVLAVFPDVPPGGPSRVQRGGRDYVRDYMLDEVRQLHLLPGAAGGEHRVPTLSEALAAAAGRVVLMLGLKVYEVESLAAALAQADRDGVILIDQVHADAAVLQGVTAATGLDAVAGMSEARDPAREVIRVAETTGSALRMVCLKGSALTPAMLDILSERAIRPCVSGWNGTEDSALIYKSDPGPWRAALAAGHVALTDRPDAVLELLGR